ncbi:hypothetical protein R1flu_000785 [Riccia fluitans]|uniref:Ribosomal protein S14 n=1 Tax=Riccia fluitans TaxID=41844 RepID=A0ABD1Y1E4_9MARC
MLRGMTLSSHAAKQQRRESKVQTYLTLQADRANKAREEPPWPSSKHRKQWQRPSTNSGIATIRATGIPGKQIGMKQKKPQLAISWRRHSKFAQ